VAEHLVEFVEVALVLHQRRACKIVEVLDLAVGEVRLQRRALAPPIDPSPGGGDDAA